MESAITLFGYLILTFLSIVVPFLSILLSIFHGGVSKLKSQYEQESKNSEKNLKEQLKRLSEAEHADLDEIALTIKVSIKDLKLINKKAKTKLSYLNPKRQVSRLFVLLLISFIGVLLTLIMKICIYDIPIFIVVSVAFFALSIYIIWKLLCILIEVRGTIDRDKNEMENKALELLSKIARTGKGSFLEKVYIKIQGELIDNKEDDKQKEFKLYLNNKNSLNISIDNLERRMAKEVEIGAIFPRDFIIEKTTHYSTFTDTNGNQIVRYYVSQIHGNTEQRFSSPLVLKPIKEGKCVIQTFIKAENIESVYRNITLNIEEVPF